MYAEMCLKNYTSTLRAKCCRNGRGISTPWSTNAGSMTQYIGQKRLRMKASYKNTEGPFEPCSNLRLKDRYNDRFCMCMDESNSPYAALRNCLYFFNVCRALHFAHTTSKLLLLSTSVDENSKHQITKKSLGELISIASVAL